MMQTISRQFRKPGGWLGRVVSRLMIKGNRREYDKMLEELGVKPGDRVFEIGYGPGIGIDQICSAFDCHVSGIDFSELMFKQASERNKIHIQKNKAELFYGDFLDFEIPAGSYDKVFCLNVIYFWDNLHIPFTKIRNSLKEGGWFCFTMASKDDLDKIPFTSDSIFNKYSIETVVAELKHAGFSDVNYTFDWVYYVKCRK
jgi:SAM-dependent methyltransferase